MIIEHLFIHIYIIIPHEFVLYHTTVMLIFFVFLLCFFFFGQIFLLCCIQYNSYIIFNQNCWFCVYWEDDIIIWIIIYIVTWINYLKCKFPSTSIIKKMIDISIQIILFHLGDQTQYLLIIVIKKKKREIFGMEQDRIVYELLQKIFIGKK